MMDNKIKKKKKKQCGYINEHNGQVAYQSHCLSSVCPYIDRWGFSNDVTSHPG